jgi:hypothetical protein
MSRLKIEAARRQLGTALALYLADADPVSVHCLAGGGCELIEYFAEKAGGEPFSTHILKTFPNMDIADVRRLQRQYWTAFKHATHFNKDERKDDELLAQFEDTQNDAALFIGWYDYAQAARALPIEAQVHQAFYIALHPAKLDPALSPKLYDDLFPGLRSQPRAEQKRMLRHVIETTRMDREVMLDPKTDLRPLIVPWDEPFR